MIKGETVQNIQPDKPVKVEEAIVHTAEECAAFFVENDLTKATYTAIRADAKRQKAPIYLEYRQVVKEMDKCVPDTICVEEHEAYVPLQDCLNITIRRLCEVVAVSWTDQQVQNLTLTVTVGSDSSPNHTNPHQAFENPDNEMKDALIPFFVTSMLICKLQSDFDDSKFDS